MFGESVLRLTDVFMCYSESCSGVGRLTTRHLCPLGRFCKRMRYLGSDRSNASSVVAK